MSCIVRVIACVDRGSDGPFRQQNCQFCTSGDHEEKLLLCDGCDKGYHTYCFKPAMDTIPDGDWSVAGTRRGRGLFFFQLRTSIRMHNVIQKKL